MKRKKEPNYLLTYLISIVLSLLIHYFFIANSSIHTTLQVFIVFVIFTIFMGIPGVLSEYYNK